MKEYSKNPEINARVCDPVTRQAGLQEAADVFATLQRLGRVPTEDIKNYRDHFLAGEDLHGRPLTRRAIAETFETIEELRTRLSEKDSREAHRRWRPVVRIRKVKKD